MKKNAVLLALAILAAAAPAACVSGIVPPRVPTETGPVTAAVRSAPFSRGVNFSAWFEADSAQAIRFRRYTEQDFINVKRLGADVVRLPVRMHSMTSGHPYYILDPLLLRLLDKAVDWAEKHEIFIIIDNHSFDPIAPTDYNIDRILLPVWAQIARRFAARSDFVIYEILNEPHGIPAERWGQIQGAAIETIRRYDPYRLIIVGGTYFNSIEALFALPYYDDPNLIYTFHFYEPFLFTHQGATWGEPSLGPLAGIPFPADPGRMPRFPAALRGTWVEGAFRYYRYDADPARITAALDRAVEFSLQRDVPVFAGEFGVFIPNSPPEDRAIWYEFVAGALSRRNISWASWDYFGGFGLFVDELVGDFYSDLNVDVVRALGFTPPPQVPRARGPIEDGFVIFDDFPGRYLTVGHWAAAGTEFSLFDENAATGEFAIRWGGAERYYVFYFGFGRGKDFSSLAASGASLEFFARANAHAPFDVRFVNRESETSVPWRMRYTIDALPPDGQWHRIQIPLSDMSEQGAWIAALEQWKEPQGEFSWSDILRLEFVSEHGPLGGSLWFDDIRIVSGGGP